jgi:hypothetical protein
MVAGWLPVGTAMGLYSRTVAILQQERPMVPLWREVQQRCRLLRFFCFFREVKAGLNRGQR